MAPNNAMTGMRPSITVAGVTFTDLDNLIVLVGSATTINNYSTLRKMGASAGYQVTAGKTLRILACRVSPTATAAANANAMGLLYGDTDVGLSSASGPTNPIYSNGSNGHLGQLFTFNYNQAFEFTTKFDVPATKYPAASATGSSGGEFMCYGYEF